MRREVGIIEGRKAGMIGKDRSRKGAALNPHCRDDRQRHRQRAAPEAAEIVDHGYFFLMVVRHVKLLLAFFLLLLYTIFGSIEIVRKGEFYITR